MKKCILLLVIAIYSTANIYAQENLKINSSKSELKWSSDYTFYFGGHYGTVQFKEGYFIKTNEKITGGEFIIDMNTIINTDGDYSEGLVNHLKNDDFFDVPKFPTSKLVITEVNYLEVMLLEVKANLTIKGITLPIKFKAEVNYEKLEMTTKFKIDRTRWGINFNSKLKSDAISDAIVFEAILSL
ncbi:YceI family protein [uncultured Lacinutrix sp.]|uniref:YceI family protein n=1 Tax=uncultured Lacinutrix sp. TaxID=574032 RepID=UPI0026332161|nr:YceI family protein [uncultured Lacinutrix sp.]